MSDAQITRVDTIQVDGIYKMTREDGSTCYYFTSPGVGAHFIIHDSLDNKCFDIKSLEAAAAAMCGGCAGYMGSEPARKVKGIWWHDWPGSTEPRQTGFSCDAVPIRALIATQTELKQA